MPQKRRGLRLVGEQGIPFGGVYLEGGARMPVR